MYREGRLAPLRTVIISRASREACWTMPSHSWGRVSFPEGFAKTPEHTSVPCSRTRGLPRKARPLTPASPLAPRESDSQLLGGFAGRISPKRHNTPAFPQVGGTDSEQPPPKTAQKSRTMAKSAPISCETAQKSRGRARGQSRDSRQRQRQNRRAVLVPRTRPRCREYVLLAWLFQAALRRFMRDAAARAYAHIKASPLCVVK